MPLFTSETAAEAARKSHSPDSARFRLPQVVAEPDDDPYLVARLNRVRAQLDKLDRMMISELDPAKLDRIASAQARLAEQERILAGRPLPGSRKPAQDRPQRRQSITPEPDPTPQQIDNSAPALPSTVPVQPQPVQPTDPV